MVPSRSRSCSVMAYDAPRSRLTPPEDPRQRAQHLRTCVSVERTVLKKGKKEKKKADSGLHGLSVDGSQAPNQQKHRIPPKGDKNKGTPSIFPPVHYTSQSGKGGPVIRMMGSEFSEARTSGVGLTTKYERKLYGV